MKCTKLTDFMLKCLVCLISHGHLTSMSIKAVNDENGNSISNQWAFTMLETEVFKYNFIKFCVAKKTVLCFLLKLVQLTLNK